MKYYILVIVLVLLSCKDKKPEEKEELKKITFIKNERKEISIDNEKFYYRFNKNNNESKVSEFFGKYTTDRFKNEEQSAILDGVSDYVEVFNEPELNPKNEITISIWYKPDSFKGIGVNSIIWKGFQEDKKPFAQYYLTVTGDLYPKNNSSFKFGLSINGLLYQINTEPNSWITENWYNIVGTYNGSQMRLYVNGKLLGKRNVKGVLDNYDTNLFIGKIPHKEFYTPGEFDDLRVFDKWLSPQEISILYSEK